MIDPGHRFTVPGVPGVVVFPDEADRAAFYAFPVAPRLAQSSDGLPEASLVVYGRGKGASFQVEGAVLTLTTSLELSPAEVSGVEHGLAQRLRGEPEGSDGGQVPRARLLPVDATGGDVEVVLTPRVHLRGSPSLTSSNRCSFNQKLDAEQARSLLPEWKEGLPGARATYRLRLRAGPATITVEVHDTTRRDRTSTGDRTSTTAGASVSARSPQATTLTVEGVLGGTAALGDRTTTVAL